MINTLDLDLAILVCEGSEYQALSRGLKQTSPLPPIITLPMGINPVDRLLKQQAITQKVALLIGLGGSLSSEYRVGDVVVYHSCSYLDSDGQLQTRLCDKNLSQNLAEKLNLPLVRGLTTDKLINCAIEKSSLQRKSDCQVVDMETFAVMNYFAQLAVIRIISDNDDDDLPDLNFAINHQGKLDNRKMILAFLQQPLAAIKLINNSLTSLQKMEQLVMPIMEGIAQKFTREENAEL